MTEQDPTRPDPFPDPAPAPPPPTPPPDAAADPTPDATSDVPGDPAGGVPGDAAGDPAGAPGDRPGYSAPDVAGGVPGDRPGDAAGGGFGPAASAGADEPTASFADPAGDRPARGAAGDAAGDPAGGGFESTGSADEPTASFADPAGEPPGDAADTPAGEPTAAFAGSTAHPAAAAGAGAAGGSVGAGGGGAGPGGTGAEGTAGGGWNPPPTYGAYGGRRLRRSKQRRVIAGVAGGLGEYTGVDPVLFRVLFVVLSLFGGAGILLYVLGWLFLPDEDQPVSPAESLIGRGTGGTGSRAGDAAQAIGLAIAAVVLGGLLIRGDAGDIVLLVVLIIGGILLARHLEDRRRDGAPPAPGVPPPPDVPPPAYQPYQAYDYPSGPGATATSTVPPVTAPPVAYGPPAPKPRKERSILGLLTLSLLLVVLGVAAAVDAAGGDAVEPRHYLALAVGVIGLGLIVGAFRGRARGMIWIGIPLTIALAAVSTADATLRSGTGDRLYRPAAISDVAPDYELGAGSVRLDLTGVDFAEQDVSTRVHAGIGDITVVVPRDVDVRVTGRSGIGEVDLFGEKVSGTSNEREVVDQGPDGPGGGDLELVLEVGVGHVEVDRAAA